MSKIQIGFLLVIITLGTIPSYKEDAPGYLVFPLLLGGVILGVGILEKFL